MSSCTVEDGTSRSLDIFRTETPFSCIFIMAGLNSFILCLKSNFYNMFSKRKLEKANKNKCPVSFGLPCKHTPRNNLSLGLALENMRVGIKCKFEVPKPLPYGCFF